VSLTRLSRAGRGSAWLARVDEADALVVIRPMTDALREGTSLRTGLDEVIAASAALQPSNLARFLGYDEVDGAECLIREFAEGISLDQAMTRWGKCGWAHAAAIVRQAAGGLQQLQGVGLKHGRLQPSNVIVAQDGSVRLVDYALPAGLIGPASPRYTAPEGARDIRSDLFSLGILAYELTTGDRATLYPQRLPPDAVPLISWLLRPNPAERPQSAEAVVAAVAGYRGQATR
jgi:serine/threonine protein kinase